MTRPSGWTAQELVDEVLASPWRVPSPIPDTRDIQRPGWFQRMTPSLHQGTFNEVSHAILSATEADAVIDRTIAAYRALGLRFRWAVTPGSKPDDLASRLAARGFASHELWGVVRDLSPVAARARNGVRVAAVADDATSDAFTDVMAAGWSMDPEDLRARHRAMVDHPGGQYRLFVAYAGEVAAGAAAYLLAGRAAYQMGGVVLPAYRRRGLYQALVEARLTEAASRGLVLATSQARADTSGPILLRLGFELVCRFPVFSIPGPDG